MKIWKFPIRGNGIARISMPVGAKIVGVGIQNSYDFCLWAEVEETALVEDRFFEVYGTGHEIQDLGTPKHLGTILTQPNGAFVWHVYEHVLNKEEKDG